MNLTTYFLNVRNYRINRDSSSESISFFFLNLITIESLMRFKFVTYIEFYSFRKGINFLYVLSDYLFIKSFQNLVLVMNSIF